MKKSEERLNLVLKTWVKGIFILLMLPMVLIGITGCDKTTGKDSDGVKIVTTIFPAYDFAKQIGKENVNVELLLSPGTETHSYEPSPQDIIKISECDIFIYVGGENDSWVDEILDTADLSKVKIIRLMDCVETVEEEYVEGMEKDHNHDEGEKEDKSDWDEHVWTSPVNAIKICKQIKNVLSEVDNGNNGVYEANCSEYEEKLEELDNAFKEVVENGKRKTLIFGDRFPVRYFTEEYDLDYYAAFPGCSADTEASASTVAFLISKIKDEKIPVVLQIELSNGNIAKTISEETGAKIYTFYACHNVTKEDFKSGKTYVDFMWENVKTLKIALN